VRASGVLQGYFAATMIEMVLQLLLVNASPNVSTLVERQQHLLPASSISG
jgi:hypothetical protein